MEVSHGHKLTITYMIYIHTTYMESPQKRRIWKWVEINLGSNILRVLTLFFIKDFTCSLNVNGVKKLNIEAYLDSRDNSTRYCLVFAFLPTIRDRHCVKA